MTREEKINTLKAIIQECEDYQWERKETLFEIIKDLEQEQKSEWEHDHEILKAYADGGNNALEKIKADIEGLTYYCCEVHPRNVIDYVLQILDKYKSESEG
jgi:hypothetical protein